MVFFYWKRLKKKDRPKCEAKCRDGHACQSKAVIDKAVHSINGKCRMHGGLSTGAKTPEGKERIRGGQRRYWAERKSLNSTE